MEKVDSYLQKDSGQDEISAGALFSLQMTFSRIDLSILKTTILNIQRGVNTLSLSSSIKLLKFNLANFKARLLSHIRSERSVLSHSSKLEYLSMLLIVSSTL